jgi:hypothetical protein
MKIVSHLGVMMIQYNSIPLSLKKVPVHSTMANYRTIAK